MLKGKHEASRRNSRPINGDGIMSEMPEVEAVENEMKHSVEDEDLRFYRVLHRKETPHIPDWIAEAARKAGKKTLNWLGHELSTERRLVFA